MLRIILLLIFILPILPVTAAAEVVVMNTSHGDIVLDLDEQKAPLTVRNFLRYVDDGFYDGTIFHRVIDGFMVQGGGFTEDLEKKPTREAIKNEAANGLPNERGTIAMARTGAVDSATAQFFINLVDNDSLNHRDTSPHSYGYAVFGRVIGGMEAVDRIARIPTRRNGRFQNFPAETVLIRRVERKNE